MASSNALRIPANIFALVASDSSFLLLLNSHYSEATPLPLPWLKSNMGPFPSLLCVLLSYCSQERAVNTRHSPRFVKGRDLYNTECLKSNIRYFRPYTVPWPHFLSQALTSDFPSCYPHFTLLYVPNNTNNHLTLIRRKMQFSSP